MHRVREPLVERVLTTPTIWNASSLYRERRLPQSRQAHDLAEWRPRLEPALDESLVHQRDLAGAVHVRGR